MPHEIFLSIILVADNLGEELEATLKVASDIATGCVTDHEIVVIDNGSSDGSVDRLRALCGEDGLPNLQVYRLAKRVEIELAAWAGVENALGDYVAIVDPSQDDIRALPDLLSASMEGADVVFGVNRKPARKSPVYGFLRGVFGVAVGRLLGIDLDREMPVFRVLSRAVVNYMVEHQASGLAYSWLPATSGFRKSTVSYETQARPRQSSLVEDIDRGVRILVSSTLGPMRAVTLLCLFGAVINVVYSGYVVAVAILKTEVAPGWVTISLQQSGMFFLFSLVLFVLGEYVIHMAKMAANAPSYFVTDEFGSARITRMERLNLETHDSSQSPEIPETSSGQSPGA
jgi:glycosyltransferase involved in cell wall biosynthesis